MGLNSLSPDGWLGLLERECKDRGYSLKDPVRHEYMDFAIPETDTLGKCRTTSAVDRDTSRSDRIWGEFERTWDLNQRGGNDVICVYLNIHRSNPDQSDFKEKRDDFIPVTLPMMEKMSIPDGKGFPTQTIYVEDGFDPVGKHVNNFDVFF